MRKIHQLSQRIVSKIAAGEVIERPVYAVKELVENAIDAHAGSIQIHIEESGLKKITVSDNGEGMSPEDLQESFKPHTTSKILHEEDLARIASLGFRGEALASIAAISRLTINSRVSKNATGISVIIKNGKLEKISPIGMPSGTTVIVEQLFHSLPVRKKFIGSMRTEFRRIIDLVTHYAISYPHMHFVLVNNKKTVLDLPKTTDTIRRIEKLLGNDIVSSLLPVSFENSYISVNGFIATPLIMTKNPGKQFLFINNRSVGDKTISLTVKSAFGTLLPSTLYPICILFLSLPVEMVDVNVHPRKEYVRFIDTNLLQDTIRRAITQTLTRYDLTPNTNFETFFRREGKGSTSSYAASLLKEKRLSWELPMDHTDYSAFLQINNIYLLMGSRSGFLLIDQHAAHERILFEQLQNEFIIEKQKHNLFHFPKSVFFDLSISESDLLKEHLDYFHAIGWEIEHFKDRTFVLRSLPVLFQDRDYVKMLKEILEDLQDPHNLNDFDSVTKKMIAYLACHGAIKAGDRLTKKQVKELVMQLEKTQNNTTCPHGRPTRIAVSLESLNQLFRR